MRYGDLADPLPAMADDLSRGRLSRDTYCHLDPDISADSLNKPRLPGWRGALGQVSAALAHLRRFNVSGGDVFIFWGRFRPCRRVDGKWVYSGPSLHAIFGWLQIEDVIDLGHDGARVLDEYPWLDKHPHVRQGWSELNTLYIARESLSFGGGRLPGYGVLKRAVRLTIPDGALSTWRVPSWLDHRSGGVGMSYHPAERWLGGGILKAAPRGQEFVADIGDQEEAREWIRSLVGENT